MMPYGTSPENVRPADDMDALVCEFGSMNAPSPIASDLLTIRPFRDTDAAALPAIFREAVEVLGARHYTPEQVRAWAALAPPSDAFLEGTRDGRSVWVAADATERAVAYADLRTDGTIDHLYCAPPAAGRGIGAALVLTLEAVARLQGLGRLRTEASEGARALFERLGWRTVRRQRVECDGTALHNDAMERELPPIPADAAPTPATEAMMAEFVGTGSQSGGATAHTVVAFGDGPAMADELAALVVAGPKRATAGLLRDFVNGEPMPVVGGHVVLVNGSNEPRAVWRTREVRVGPIEDVDEAFAWDEGEGDRTRADWLAMHRRYFADAAEREGLAFHDRLPTVFERFAVVWPLRHAD